MLHVDLGWCKMFLMKIKWINAYTCTVLSYISVTCVIMQKNGAGLHTASSCFWDNSTDGRYPPLFPLSLCLCLCLSLSLSLSLSWSWIFRHSCNIVLNQYFICIFTGSCTVRWENKTMYCIVSVFGLAI